MAAQTERLDEIRNDVREIRGALIVRPNTTGR